MIIAIDTNSILPGQVGGIENYCLGLIEALKLPGSPAERLVLLTRPENQELFAPLKDIRTQTVLLERPAHEGKPVTNWSKLLERHPESGQRALANFQQKKAALLHQLNVDLVHFPGNTINPLDLDLPTVLNLHDLQHRHFPQYFSRDEIENREKWWVRSAFRADAMMAASNYVRDDLQKQLRLDPAKVFVTPDVLESKFFRPPAAKQILDVKRRFSLAKQFFVYPAAVWPHKNHERLIRAFVAAELDGAQLILTGGGQAESTLRQLIEDLDAASNILLAGRVSTEDLVALYHLATGLVFPSEHEAWSIPIMEAMACGCPVASSNVTSLPEEVGDAGLLFDPGDLAGMSAAMRALAADESLRITLSRRGRERVKDFGPQPFLKTITAAYEYARSVYRTRKAA